ncbi:hypothetical protein [Bacillus ndiopicus]|uniref:hypothetical protein n=1 Tax=Bacillus ndiopicus TaxID=1347368 RepID=UPI000AEB4DA0|nr:hypothetical protein [Bacillus ndiopicus]
MKMNCCENCGRAANIVEMNKLSIEGHVAELCVACHYVLAQESQRARFFTLVRSKDKQSSNSEMQKVHRQLSLLIGAGIFVIACLSGVAIADNMDILQTASVQQQHYLTFAELNRY